MKTPLTWIQTNRWKTNRAVTIQRKKSMKTMKSKAITSIYIPMLVVNPIQRVRCTMVIGKTGRRGVARVYLTIIINVGSRLTLKMIIKIIVHKTGIGS
jgi:hypothetical protein